MKVSVRTIYTLLDNGTLPAYKAGGVTRVRADDLEEMMTPYPVKRKAAKAAHRYDNGGKAPHVTRRGGKGKTGAKKASGK